MMAHGRRLLRAWGVLVLLTVVSVATALAGGGIEGGGRMAATVAAIASLFKARQVLDHYLDLRRAGGGWSALFTILLVAVLGVCLACALLAPAPT